MKVMIMIVMRKLTVGNTSDKTILETVGLVSPAQDCHDIQPNRNDWEIRGWHGSRCFCQLMGHRILVATELHVVDPSKGLLHYVALGRANLGGIADNVHLSCSEVVVLSNSYRLQHVVQIWQ